MSQIQDIIQLEKSNKKDFNQFLLASMEEMEDEEELAQQLPVFSRKISNEIKDMRKEAEKLADQHSEEAHKNKEARNLIIAVASLNLARYLASSVIVQDNDNYSQSVKKSIKDSQAVIAKVVITETFSAYNQKFKANYSFIPGHYKWNATLDNRTCAYCEDLDGKEFENEDEVPDFHINCRCYLEFIKD